MARVSDILDTLPDLPALPGSVLRVTSLLSDDTSSVSDIHEAIRTDEALATAVLGRANSAAFGTPGRVFSLSESVTRLGRREVGKIVMTQGIGPIMEQTGDIYGMHRRGAWRGAVGGAFVAEQMAKDVGFEPADVAFVSAVLRDIGKLAVEAYLSQRDTHAIEHAAEEDGPFIEQERAIMGMDHAEMGAELARRWGVPDRIAEVIRFHHAPPAEGETHDQLFDIVHAADTVCLWAGLGVGHDGLSYPLAPHVRAALLPNRTKAESYIAYAWTAVKELEAEILGSDSMEECA